MYGVDYFTSAFIYSYNDDIEQNLYSTEDNQSCRLITSISHTLLVYLLSSCDPRTYRQLVNAKSSKLRKIVVEVVVACAFDPHRQCVSLVENLHKTSVATAPLVIVRRLILCPCVNNNLVVPVDTESTPRLSGLWIIMQLCVDIVKSVFGNGNVSTAVCHPASQDWRIPRTATSGLPPGNKRAWANQEETECH